MCTGKRTHFTIAFFAADENQLDHSFLHTALCWKVLWGKRTIINNDILKEKQEERK